MRLGLRNSVNRVPRIPILGGAGGGGGLVSTEMFINQGETNGQRGATFSLTPAVDVSITGFRFAIYKGGAATDINIYFKEGGITYNGFADYTLHETIPVNNPNGITFTWDEKRTLTTPLDLVGGTKYSFFVELTNGSGNNLFVSNRSLFKYGDGKLLFESGHLDTNLTSPFGQYSPDMFIYYDVSVPNTEHYTDFSEYDTGVAPSDWTERFGVGANQGWTVEADASATGGKVLRRQGTALDDVGLSWDVADAINNAKVEMRFKVTDVGSGDARSDAYIFGRGTDADSVNRFIAGTRGDDFSVRRLYKGVDKNESNENTSISTATWYELVAEFRNGDISVVLYNDGRTEIIHSYYFANQSIKGNWWGVFGYYYGAWDCDWFRITELQDTLESPSEFYTDFSEDALNAFPEGFFRITQENAGANVLDDFFVVDTVPNNTDALTGGKALNFQTTNNFGGLMVKSLYGVQDVELHVRFLLQTTGDRHWLITRGEGRNNSYDVLGARYNRSDANLDYAYYQDNSFSNPVAFNKVLNHLEWLEIKLRVVGDNLKVKVWEPGVEAEPAWQIDETVTADVFGNWVGIWNNTTDEVYVDFLRATPI